MYKMPPMFRLNHKRRQEKYFQFIINVTPHVSRSFLDFYEAHSTGSYILDISRFSNSGNNALLEATKGVRCDSMNDRLSITVRFLLDRKADDILWKLLPLPRSMLRVWDEPRCTLVTSD